MTSEQAINAGLLTELMTVVEQPTDPEAEPIIPSKLTGKYKLSTTKSGGNFTGYAFVVNQTSLTAETIGGEFESTDEMTAFIGELKNSGASFELEDSSVTKYSADDAIKQKLIFNVRGGKTTIEGSFEVSEGVVKISQTPFIIGESSLGIFRTAEDLLDFIEKCMEDLKTYNQVQKMYTRQGYAFKDKENKSERVLDRNRKFWANPEKYLPDGRSRFLNSRIFQLGRIRYSSN